MRGNTLILIGIGFIVVGVLARFGLLSWFGHLPGDIRINNEGSFVFIPIASMIIVSVVGSILLNVVTRFFAE